MIVRVDDTVFRGRTVTIERDVDPDVVARAVRNGAATGERHAVAVRSQTPPPVHERVGCLHPEMGVKPKTALASAGRARGLSTRFDEELRARRRELREVSVEHVETAPQRASVADATAETAALREEVAETRGRLAAHRALDGDVAELEVTLESAARDLSEAETTAVAAEQTLDRQRAAARAARETLDRRMHLEDALANCRRKARAALVERLRDAFASAVAAAPGGPETVPADPFAVDPVTAGLALARLADFDAPVVVACDRFETPDAASAWLGAPVVALR